MWGIIPAAGSGTRIQPLAFSKELLPVGSRIEDGTERPRAVSEYVIDRMINAGADKICLVISPWKADILHYYGGAYRQTPLAYAVQPQPAGLCDAIFSALPLVQANERVIVGLPDTVWFPEDALSGVPGDRLFFLLFPVERPEFFDAVLTDDNGRVLKIQVKSPHAGTRWVWGAFGMPGAVLHELHRLWLERDRHDIYVGSLVNAYLETGGAAWGIRRGASYVDVGTLNGYREAMHLLARQAERADGEDQNNRTEMEALQ